MATLKKLSMAPLGAVLIALGIVDVVHATTLVLPESGRQSLRLVTGEDISFIANSQDTGGQFSLFDFNLQSQIGPSPHIHSREDEAFYVLDGEVSLQHEDHATTLVPGDFVYLDRGHAHGFRDLGTTPARLIDIALPSGIENLFKAATPLPPIDSSYFDKVTAISTQYGITIPNTFFFTDYNYSVKQDGTTVQPATVLRLGNSQGVATAIADLSDSTGKDIKIPVNFADGERIKTVDIPVTNQGLAKGTYTLTLSDPTGNSTPALLQNKAYLNIVDNNAFSSDSGNTSNSVQELYNLPVVQPPQRKSFSVEGGTASIVATTQDTNGEFSLYDVLLPAYSKTQPYYIKSPFNEGFYVLDGDVSFQVGDQNFTATPDTFVYLSQGETYEFDNLGTTSARLLFYSFPPTAVPEPSFTWGLLPLFAWGAVSLRKNKLKKQKLAHR